MEKKKVKFDGFYRKDGKLNTEAQMMLDILRSHYEVELSDTPDYVFYNVDGETYYKYDGIRIFCTIEAICPDFNLCDYGIGFENLTYGDRYLCFPNYCFYPEVVDRMAEKHLKVAAGMADREFCSFVYSNGEADHMRVKLFQKLSEYKHVDAGGRLLNNQPKGQTIADKYLFESNHKFSIACENTSHPGYHTEKLAEAFAAGTVPVYWGDPDIEKIFNPKAFINCQAYSTLDEVVERVAYLDSHPEAYLQMLKEPAFLETVDGSRAEYETGRLKNFLLQIFEPPLELAYRRNRGFWGKNYLQKKRSEARVVERYMKVRSLPFIRFWVEMKARRGQKRIGE